jgi:excisionase family DNA binding protein
MKHSLPTPDSEEFMTSSQAAELLYVSPQTLRDWSEEDRLDVYETPGGHRRYKEFDVLALLRQVQGHDKCYRTTAFIEMNGQGEFILPDSKELVANELEIATVRHFKNPLGEWCRQLIKSGSPVIGDCDKDSVEVISYGVQGMSVQLWISCLAFEEAESLSVIQSLGFAQAQQVLSEQTFAHYGVCAWTNSEGNLIPSAC